jgi:copper chaperone
VSAGVSGGVIEVKPEFADKVHNTRFVCLCIFKGFEMKQIFTVTGMTCEHCEKAVVRAVRQLDRAAEVQADRTRNRVEVDSEQAREALAQAIAKEGYTVVS